MSRRTLLRRADAIRGFGPVKDAALAAYYEGLPAARASLEASTAEGEPSIWPLRADRLQGRHLQEGRCPRRARP